MILILLNMILNMNRYCYINISLDRYDIDIIEYDIEQILFISSFQLPTTEQLQMTATVLLCYKFNEMASLDCHQNFLIIRPVRNYYNWTHFDNYKIVFPANINFAYTIPIIIMILGGMQFACHLILVSLKRYSKFRAFFGL